MAPLKIRNEHNFNKCIKGEMNFYGQQVEVKATFDEHKGQSTLIFPKDTNITNWFHGITIERE